jgi:hypothetical protein
MFLSEAVKSAKRPHTLHESKALNMGIAELEPHHHFMAELGLIST